METIPSRGVALIRRPSPRLADGLVTHIERMPVDVDLARGQHAAYVSALRDNGWTIREVAPADDCPDAVFIEDAVAVFGDLAVLARSGARSRRGEAAGAEEAVRALGLTVARITPPGTLDGGDILQIGTTVYVGHGGRTNSEGIEALRDILAPSGRTVVAVTLDKVLHLKSAITALPDGTCLTLPGLVDTGVFRTVRFVDEEAGAHVVPIGGDTVIIAASAPRTATVLSELGYSPVVVDISEYEKMEGCVTCLSVLVQRG